METLEQKRVKAQYYLDKIIAISDNFNNGTSIKNPNGTTTIIGKDGVNLGYFKDNNTFVNITDREILSEQYRKYIKELGFTFINDKVVTFEEYEIIRKTQIETESENQSDKKSNSSIQILFIAASIYVIYKILK